MRLSKIKLAGFKSFVDPTTFHLPSNLVGIVGPNGCGKSNIIDAVRWVMGESSAKHLRGDSMEDVIFNGSTSRKPVGQASIEMVFDNSEGKLGGQYAQYSEISVKRLVTRDGQSQYSLNNTRCRRKDITDIFLGTGLGPRSYSIIEQGMISRLIEAKPADMRVFIEEAAGISKYKERRRETELRIQHTRDNLSRLNDLREELTQRLETLNKQSRAAERYKELKEEERLLKGQLLALRWKALHDESESAERHVRALENALEALTAELRRIEAQSEQTHQLQVDAADQFNAVQADYYRVGAEVARLEQTIQHNKENRVQQEKELRETESAWQGARTYIEDDKTTLAKLAEDLARDESSLNVTQIRARESAEKLAANEQEMHAWQQRWDEFNSRAAEQLRHAEVERARIEHLEEQVAQAHRRREQLQVELASLGTDALQLEVAQLDARAEREQEQLDQADEVIAARQQEIAQTRRSLQELNERMKAAQRTAAQAREEFVSLAAVQAQALQQDDVKVNDWLAGHEFAQAPRLAQALRVASGWERAVETVLQPLLDAVVANSASDDVLRSLSQLDEGALTLVTPADVASASYDSNRLAAKVQGFFGFHPILAKVYVADSIDAALARRTALQADESVITADGLWVGPNWCRVRRGERAEVGVLERERRLAELASRRDHAQESVETLEDEIAQHDERLRGIELARDGAQRERQQFAERYRDVATQLSGKRARLDSLTARRERIERESSEHEAAITRSNTDYHSARQRLSDAILSTEGHDRQREVLLEERDTWRIQLEQVRAQARADQEAAHQVELHVRTMRTQRTATQERLDRTEKQLELLSRRREELQRNLLTGEAPLTQMGEQLAVLLQQRLTHEQALANARRVVEEHDHRLRELNTERQRVEQRLQQQREDINRAQMGWQEARVRAQTLTEQIAETGHPLDVLLAQMPPEASVPAWEESLDRVGRSIQRLGPINLAAIDEFREQSERKQYLDAQDKDLTDALETLETAMQKIDRETRARFQETFDRVNTGLQAKFPRLFGGGHAYLELTSEELLEAGVTVMARPPGKKNSTIHLLSGGEKALTAVALVFSIFDLNPAPFCMLDEVDAPLDDANVGRFCALVKEMAQRVQFIFITHNKATMEMAMQLTGVTMHEPGVSRLVAVDVDEAVELVTATG